MKEDSVTADQQQRDRIANALDENLFVEAGAGTGKTRALVTRVANLVASGRARVDGVAAITFTEAAAAELRDRIRRELEEKARDPEIPQHERERCFEAASGLENASIQTLHSFAGALLRERPLEAGLPPGFDVVEEIEADIDFEERWRQWVDEALESETIAPYLRRALNLGLRLHDLRTVARSFHENYDLVPGGFAPEAEPQRRAARRVVEASFEIRQLLPLAHLGPDDPLARHSGGVAQVGERLDALGADSDAALALLATWGKLSSTRGKQGDWDTNPATGLNACKDLKGLLKELEESRNEELELVRRAAIIPLLESLRCFALDYAEERRKSGKAGFHDLLVWARDMLRDNPVVRAHFQQRFTHILIDEFQDTDPIQAEIAFFLSGDTGKGSGVAGRAAEWTGMELVPGKLFVVGDPKQSIYRFRRADIASVEEVRDLMTGDTVPLSQNFRSQDTIINWVNCVFAAWMGGGMPAMQAPYRELAAWWHPAAAEPPLGVHCCGGTRDLKMGRLRREEAEAVAAVLRQIKSGSWKVRDGEHGALRDADYRDVCILMPTRTGLLALERALEAESIPFRVESQSLVLGTQDVRELLACLRAIDSPADEVALVAALRSSAFACSDVELLQFVDDGGRLDHSRPGTGSGPVQDALEVLQRYHSERTWTPTDELIEKFVRERRMAEVCFARPRPRERLRRLRFVVERARAFSQVTGGSLRGFLDWIERQADENARMVEVPVPEMDEDAVRVMTIHAAKGLEFPIVMLTGLGSNPRHSSGPVVFDRRKHKVEVSLKSADGSSFSTSGYEDAQRHEQEAAEAEDVRLMYVSTTRARDHLIVSLFRPEKNQNSRAAVLSELLAGEAGLWREITLSPRGIASEVDAEEVEDVTVDTAADREDWLRKRQAVIGEASRPDAVAVTTIARMEKEEADRGEIAYRRGRGGTNVGRAVHSVLQSVDLATAEGLEEMSRAQAAAEGIADRWREVARLARRGLESAVVKRAVASGRYYREVFVSVPLAEGLVEGFIDLLFEEDNGLVIADYKTDMVDNEAALAEKQKEYGLQAGAYAFVVSEATGRPVKEVVLVFLHPNKEIAVCDVDTLKAEARDRARTVLSGTACS